jgi:hypothetical protein
MTGSMRAPFRGTVRRTPDSAVPATLLAAVR